MKNNLIKTVIDAIAKTQDGGMKRVNPYSDYYSEFIMNIIDDNVRVIPDDDRDEYEIVLVEEVVSNFNYMIDQLKKALVPLQTYLNEHPE